MQEVGWICNLWLLWQMCGGQHPPVTTSRWANPPPGHPGLSLCLEHLTLSTHVHQSPEAQLQDQTLVRAFSCACSQLPHRPGSGWQPSSPGPLFQFSIRVVCTQHMLYLRRSSNCFCKTSTLPSFTTVLGGRASNCSHFTGGETEAQRSHT